MVDLTRKTVKIIGGVGVNVAVQEDVADTGIFICWPADFILSNKLKEFQDEYENLGLSPIKFVASYKPL